MICTVAIFGSLAAQAGKGDSGRRFWGLWEAVDSLDGSTEQISISKGGDGSLTLLWRESYWSICDGRRGILRGAGEISSDNRRTLVIEMAITCFAPRKWSSRTAFASSWLAATCYSPLPPERSRTFHSFA